MSTSSVVEIPNHAGSYLVTARDAAALCGLGISTWWRYLSSGKVPAAVKIGGSVRWRRDELIRWLDADCPPREKWESMDRQRPPRK